MPKDFRFYVYMMNSSSRRALYTGMTNNLVKRVWQHKTHEFEGFTADYACTRLVWYEVYHDVRNAIAREKQIKRWRRDKKVKLIEAMNPEWRDLAADWYEAQGPSTRASRARRLLGMTE